ncbi:MAG: beta-galactosidase [Ruminococcaceae bacterium]|nr:beta-galactosidase [Oscillospiraceae bacterium]
MNTYQIPRPEHPNPQWERKNWVNLNGEWLFEMDRGASGENRGLQNADTLSGKITLPFCPESSLSGVGCKDFMLQVWYKKVLTFTEDDLSGKRVIFHIGGADYETKVWVNGTLAGLPHIGGYTSFEYDITKLLNVGENIITISCYDDTRSPMQPRGKQSEVYESKACDYTRNTGIWQTVWYEIVPESYIKYARIIPDLENVSVSINTELCGRGDLSAEVFYEGRKVGEASKKNLSVTGELEIKLSEKHIWELGHGRLYDLILRFGSDEVKSYFGLRKVEMQGMKFMLNGKSVFQRLVLDQGYYIDGVITAPTEDDLIRDIQCGLDAGFNGARLHQKVFEPRYLYHCDRMGYMVWGEYGNWGIDYSNLAGVANYLPDWLSAVKRDFNHPSIIGWMPFNETWDYGPQAKRCDPRFINIIYSQTKILDPTRPCVDASGNYHVVTDIFDVHDYEQNYTLFKEHYDRLYKENDLYDRVGKVRQCWNGEPVMVSEYGGIGFQLENNGFAQGRKGNWSYGKAAFSFEEFYERYEALTTAILDNPMMCGFCYTQLTDVEQEKNGLFNFADRSPKFDMAVISRINKKKAAIEE